jgi:methyltransferase-like protein
MAFAFPKSRFVGVDLAPSQIDTGRLAVSDMGLRNITLEARSIGDIDDSYGEFDYIICHGVYSWVPPEIQEAILRVCSRNLAPDGIAYVSYNTYPGWHQRGMLRDMMKFHDIPSLPPAERIARARAFAKFLGAVDPDNDAIHSVALREEVEQLSKQSDQHMFHEQLEPYNEPLYFAEFARRAAAHGLQYVGEAKPSPETAATGRTRDALGDDHDPIETEQYLDFILGRTFRRTLLCHAGVRVAPRPLVDAVERLYLRTRAVPVPPAEADANVPGVEAFQTPNKVTITTNNPLLLGVLHVLADAAPAVVSFADLERLVLGQLGGSADPGARKLAGNPGAVAATALQCAPNGLVEFRSLPSRFVARPGVRPKASGLARWQSISSETVTSLGHWSLFLSGMERFVLQHLDGANDRAQLVRLTERALAEGDLSVSVPTPNRNDISGVIDEVLDRLGRSGLLVT